MKFSKNVEKYQGIILVILLVLTFVSVNFLIPFVLGILKIDKNISDLGIIFIRLLIMLALVIFTATLKFETNNSIVGKYIYPFNSFSEKGFKNTFKKYKFIILAVILLTIFNTLLADVINLISVYFKDVDTELIRVQAPNFKNFIILMVVYAILPAIIEEITYRGLYVLTYGKNKKILFLASVVLFSLMHANIISMVTTFLLGMFLLDVVMKTSNLKLAIILHTVYNVVALIISNYIVSPFSIYAVNNLNNKLEVLGFVLINFAIAILVFLLLIVIYIKNRPQKNELVIKTKYEYRFSAFFQIAIAITFLIYTYISSSS